MTTKQQKLIVISSYIGTLLFAFSLLCICGCEDNSVQNQHSGPGKVTKMNGAAFGLQCRIIEFTLDEKTHEYLDYDRGICHYPECKYCKERKKQ